VNTVMNLRVPQNVGKFLSSCATGGFSRRVQLHGYSQLLFWYYTPELNVIAEELQTNRTRKKHRMG
jgi:hypothetical protein